MTKDEISEITKHFSVYDGYGNLCGADEILDVLSEQSVDVEYKKVGNVYGGLKRVCPNCDDVIYVLPEAIPLEKYCRFCGVRFRQKEQEE